MNINRSILTAVEALLLKKDGDTREKFKRRLGFDLFIDRDRYDIVLNNTALIPEATDQAAEAGIVAFAPAVLSATRYCIDRIVRPGFDADGSTARELVVNSRGMITRISSIAKGEL